MTAPGPSGFRRCATGGPLASTVRLDSVSNDPLAPRIRSPLRSAAPALRAGALLALAAAAAYATSFRGAFVYDGQQAIVENLSLRRFAAALAPPPGTTVSGRPLLNLSFALNYAVSGGRVWSYHALNLLIHFLAGLALFGIARRTLAGAGPSRPWAGIAPGRADPGGRTAWLAALVIALLWTVHPLQTEAVTYVVQRAESLMGLFWLVTLYAFIRATEPPAAGGSAPVRWGWYAAAVLSCLAGVGTKEDIATVPLLVFLYDRTFVSGSFRGAWRRHRWLHLGLAATWLPLLLLVLGTGGNRGGTIGFGTGVAWWAYALTQAHAVARYLGLALWPSSLTFNYGTFWVSGLGGFAPYAAVVLPLLAAAVWALVRRPALGFLGAWFFVILAPTSSVIPGTREMIVEYRMYLPLAAVVALAVAAALRWGGLRGVAALLVLALPLAVLTARRNLDYRSGLALWRDTVAKRPDNATARVNLADALLQAGDAAEALRSAQAALLLDPASGPAEVDLGVARDETGDPAGALAAFQAAVRLDPRFAPGHLGLGNAWFRQGRWGDAVAEYARAVWLEPGSAVAHCSLGDALVREGRMDEAIGNYRTALQLDPDYPDAALNLGNALAAEGRLPEAVASYARAVRLRPNYPELRFNYGVALARAGDLPQAAENFEAAVRLRPGFAEAHFDLGLVLQAMGRRGEAAREMAAARRIRPDFAVPSWVGR
jgi:protein O-mannosyl-transferase